MAITYFPFDSGAGADSSEDRWSLMARHWLATGVLDDAPFTLADAPLEVFADSTGAQVKIHPGCAAIKGFYFQSTEQETVTVAVNSSGNPRKDLVVLRLDTDADTITFAILPGTPAASPSPPTPTQDMDAGTWELPLAEVRAEHGWLTIAADKVTDRRFRVRSADFAPRGEIAYGSANTTVTGIDGGGTTLASTQEVYVPAGRKVKVSAHVRGISGTLGEQFAFKIFRDATQLQESVVDLSSTDTQDGGTVVQAREVIATSDLYAWSIEARRVAGVNPGTVTMTVNGGVEILAEDIGAEL